MASIALPTRKLTALVVDDSGFWASFITGVLRNHGYEVITVRDGLSAVEQLRQMTPALVVTDYFLANVDGGKICRLAKARGDGDAPRTLMITGGLDREMSRPPSAFADVVIAKNQPEVVARHLVDFLAQPAEHRESVVGCEGLAARAAVAKLHSMKRYLDALHEGIGDLVICVDDQLRVFSLNARAGQLLDITEPEALAKPVERLLGIPAAHDLIQVIREALAQAQPPRVVPAEVRGASLRVRVSAITGPDGRNTVLLVARDVTELATAEAQRLALYARAHQNDKMIALGQLTAGIAHEINNPLAALLPNLEFLEDTADPQERRGLLADCRDAAERIRQVTVAMRKLGHTGVERGEEVRVEEIIRSALPLVAAQVHAIGARIVCEFAQTARIVANATELSQAFLNVLVNAAQALEEHQEEDRWIRVRTAAADGGLCVSIENNGPEIPQAHRSKIFDPFFTTKTVGKGTGLGLSIAFDMIRRHGGYIELRSTSDAPTCFFIWLPLDTGVPESKPTSARRGSRTAYRLLYVDDEELLRKSYGRVLSEYHQVVVAGSGERALEILAEDAAFDLVLCDLIMPGLSGMEVFEKIRRRDPALAQRFAFLTGGTFSPEARAFLGTVDNPRAFKPLEADELLGLVDDAVGAREASGDKRRRSDGPDEHRRATRAKKRGP